MIWGMRVFTLRTELWLPRPRTEVFAFFGEAGNLQAITPEWLSFFILTPQPIEMGSGRLIDYRIRLRGFPMRWQSEITAWEPPFRFIDEQRRGPYRMWRHEHLFEERKGGTLVVDEVRYAVWGGLLVERFFVRPDLERIFAFRQRRMRELLGRAPAE